MTVGRHSVLPGGTRVMENGGFQTVGYTDSLCGVGVGVGNASRGIHLQSFVPHAGLGWGLRSGISQTFPADV